MQYRLYHYWRSSCSWRVRWGLALKQIFCDFTHVDLLKGEQRETEYLRKSASGSVPLFEVRDKDGTLKASIAESSAILEWMEETFQEPRLLPADPYKKAFARQLTQIINSGIQPIQNLQVMQFHSEDKIKQKEWTQHWIRKGLTAYEAWVKKTAGKFSLGDDITMPDLFLIPQIYNAERFDVSLSSFPTIEKIYRAALATPSCHAAHPDRFKPEG